MAHATLTFPTWLRGVLLLACFCCCQREVDDKQPPPSPSSKPLFDSVPSKVSVQPLINEASGIADSKLNPGHLWVQEDGGNPAQLYLLQHNGSVMKTSPLRGLANRDWEEMALSGSDIYLGEIGDNNAAYSECAFYKFTEPHMAADTVRTIETIRYRYADGPRDAEAFFVDPATKAIYIITKRDASSRIYKLTPPFTAGALHVADQVGQLPYNGVVAAAISDDGKEVIVKTYFSLQYYTVAAGEKPESSLQKNPVVLPYTPEPQGEAVCFSAGGNGYFTLSEKGNSSSVQLFFYKRN